MNPNVRLAAGIGLCAILWSAVTCSGAAAREVTVPSVCRRLVAQMHRSRAAMLPEAAHGLLRLRPWIEFPATRLSQNTAAYRQILAASRAGLPKVETPFPIPNGSIIDALQGTDLFAVHLVEGTDNCLFTRFVEWHRGAAAHAIAGPDFPEVPCAGQYEWAKFAVVLSQPAYLQSGPGSHHSGGMLYSIALWNAGKWERPCSVSIRFKYEYPLRLRYCAADRSVCQAARQIAPVIERRYSAYWGTVYDGGGYLPILPFQFHRPIVAQERALVSRARHIAVAAAERQHAPAYIRSAIPMYFSFFPLSLEHKLYLAALTRGSDPAWIARWILPDIKRYVSARELASGGGSLLFVFSSAVIHSNRLMPLAVLSLHERTRWVKSIEGQAAR